MLYDMYSRRDEENKTRQRGEVEEDVRIYNIMAVVLVGVTE